MKNAKQFFKVFLTSVFVILAFVGCNSTSDVDGKYNLFIIRTFTGELDFANEREFKSGKILFTDASGIPIEGNFEILDNDVIQIQLDNDRTESEFSIMKYKINRDESGKVIGFSNSDFVFERIME
jgi:hypothetical protein